MTEIDHLGNINSRLAGREQDISDCRQPYFIQDNWQTQFLDALHKRQSIRIHKNHHAGLDNKDRVAVQILFHNRYIQVVFSTATLHMDLIKPLPVHMPTKIVAFLKDPF
ncbi:unnamed protein product [Rotaria sordida]|uniref:Uncharacterized protein n=1 Tax=Rotaria sordida TaxID=392033 RepID=A0A814E389_9BILA|nr:unnamed protein product [Rotaria sordida]CAF3726514.1 unnamed protein product [Rotaria sordida]